MERRSKHIANVTATGQVGRRKVLEIWKRDRSPRYTINRINYDGETRSLERGATTLRDTKVICANILRSARYTDIEFTKANDQ